jgi:hypothetical protein
MRLHAVALLQASLVVGSSAVRADETLRVAVRVEAGAEHDTNPARIETVNGTVPEGAALGSPLGRLVTGVDLLARPGHRQTVSLAGGLAGKWFVREELRAEDVLVAEGRGSYGLALSDRTALTFVGAYYDVFQRGQSLRDARDFRSIAPGVRLERALGMGRLLAGAGWRWFLFKPERAFDFSGPSAVLNYRHAWLAALGEEGADWEWGAGATVEARRFGGPRCPSRDDCPPPPPTDARQDQFLVVHTELTRTADALVGGGLALHANRSNSFGESLSRVVLHLRGVFLLPWRLSLAARGELVATRYHDPVPVGHSAMTGMFVSIEEESRSTLRIDLARPFGGHADLGLRYTLYSASPLRTGPVDYRRQTVLGYVAFTLER